MVTIYYKVSVLNIIVNNWKKHKWQGMSEHLKDPQNTSDARGLTWTILLQHLKKIVNVNFNIYLQMIDCIC